MVSTQSIPAVISAAITIYVGCYHLVISRHRVNRREDISFALTCFAMGLYAAFAAGVYNAGSPAAGAPWQRGQLLALALVGGCFMWFVSDYTRCVSARARWTITAFFTIMAVTMLFGEPELIFNVERQATKQVGIGWVRATYHEVAFGPFVHIQVAGSLLVFTYVLVAVRRLFAAGHHERAWPLFLATLLFFVGAVNDAYVGLGVYRFFYVLEYTYAGMVFLMAFTFSRELGEVSQTRAHLSRLEHRFAAFFHNTAIGLALTTDEGEILMANPGLCRMFGVGEPAHLLGNSILDHFHAEDRMSLHTLAAGVARGEVSACRTEKRYWWPDRQVYWGDISIAEIPTETASSAGLIWIMVGITERRKAVESLRLLNEQLEERIRERTESLRQSNRHLEASLLRLQQDEEAGKRIQFRMLPPATLRVGDVEFAHHLMSSLTMCGDFVDYFRIDETHIGFYVADVSGHGVSSALVTVLLKSYVGQALDRFHATGDRRVLEPAALLDRLNAELLQEDVEKHMTVFYGVIDSETGCLTFANAGQFPYPILYEDDRIRHLDVKGTPVGMFPGSVYTNHRAEMAAPSTLVMFSDGILEILPPVKLLDKLRYLDTLVTSTGGNVDRMVMQLGLDDQKEPPDDMTILSIRRSTS